MLVWGRHKERRKWKYEKGQHNQNGWRGKRGRKRGNSENKKKKKKILGLLKSAIQQRESIVIISRTKKKKGKRKRIGLLVGSIAPLTQLPKFPTPISPLLNFCNKTTT